jgi:hypothetical protein
MNTWIEHKAAHAEVIRLRDELAQAEQQLDKARKAVIEHVAGALAVDVGFNERETSSGDPLVDFLKAAESRYAENLGQYAKRKPLQIEIVNPSDYSQPLAEALTVLAGATAGGPNEAAVTGYEEAVTQDSEPPLDTEPRPGSSPAVET